MSVIGIDVDGVLANFFPPYEKLWIKYAGGVNLFPPDTLPPTWNWPEFYGYDPSLASKVWADIKTDPDFWFNEDAMPGADDFIAAISNSSHEVYFITDRPGIEPQNQTSEWLIQHGYLDPSVIISRKGKGVVCDALSIDYYIDDKAENIKDVVKKSPSTKVFCLDYPYNREKADLLVGSIVITSLEDFLGQIGQV